MKIEQIVEEMRSEAFQFGAERAQVLKWAESIEDEMKIISGFCDLRLHKVLEIVSRYEHLKILSIVRCNYTIEIYCHGVKITVAYGGAVRLFDVSDEFGHQIDKRCIPDEYADLVEELTGLFPKQTVS